MIPIPVIGKTVLRDADVAAIKAVAELGVIGLADGELKVVVRVKVGRTNHPVAAVSALYVGEGGSDSSVTEEVLEVLPGG